MAIVQTVLVLIDWCSGSSQSWRVALFCYDWSRRPLWICDFMGLTLTNHRCENRIFDCTSTRHLTESPPGVVAHGAWVVWMFFWLSKNCPEMGLCVAKVRKSYSLQDPSFLAQPNQNKGRTSIRLLIIKIDWHPPARHNRSEANTDRTPPWTSESLLSSASSNR